MSVVQRASKSTTGRRPRTFARRWATAPLLTVLLLSACGGGDEAARSVLEEGSPPKPGEDTTVDNGDVGLPKVTLTFDIEGAETLKGDLDGGMPPVKDQPLTESCAAYAKGGTKSSGERTFLLPLLTPLPLGDNTVMFAVRINEYTGPGMYTEPQVSGNPWIQTGKGGPYEDSADVGGAGATVTVNADGSGELTFERLFNQEKGDPGPEISGRVSWTCKDGG